MNIFFLISFVPFLILFAMACEVFFRFKKNRLHQVTAYILLSLAFLFLAEYAFRLLPLEEARLFLLIFKYSNSFIIMCLAIYYFRRMFNLPVTGVWYLVSTIPLTGIALVALWPDVFYNEIMITGTKRVELISTPLFVLLMVGMIFSFILMIFSFIKAYNKAYQDTCSVILKKRIHFLVKNSVWTLASITVIVIVVSLGEINGISLSYLSPFGSAHFAFTIRYAMVHFDFLETSNHKYKLLFKTSTNGIILIDNKFRIIEANPAFCKLFGRDEEGVLYNNFLTMLSNYGCDLYVKSVKEAFLCSEHLNEVYSLNLDDGSKLILELKSDYIELEDKKYAYLMLRDITKQKENDKKLHYLAYHDSLTGLGNRRLFYERFDEMIQEQYLILAVTVVDLDNFKSINDQFGHATGDKVIQHVANQVIESIPKHAHVSRMGGDEFAILIPSEDMYELESMINTLSANLNDTLLTEEGHRLYISGSIGTSIASIDGEDIDTLLKVADDAMYAAKNNGN